jgi:hypothetical protein
MTDTTLTPLMVHVERVVRPVRASARHKGRMREELLAHVTAVYEEELSRLGDAGAARDRAARRLGDPAALTGELQQSVPRGERLVFALERWFGWHAPETAARYTLRVALTVLALDAVLFAALVALLLVTGGPEEVVLARLRPGAALLFVIGVDHFLLGLLYFKLRDALCGAWGARRSGLRASAFAALAALAVLASGLGCNLLALGSLAVSLELLPVWFPLALLAPLGMAVAGLVYGPRQIRHTEWACLDLGG